MAWVLPLLDMTKESCFSVYQWKKWKNNDTGVLLPNVYEYQRNELEQEVAYIEGMGIVETYSLQIQKSN